MKNLQITAREVPPMISTSASEITLTDSWIVVMTLERHSNVVLAGPDIVSRGFVYVRESEDLMEHARQVVETALDSCLENNITDWGKIKTEVKDALGEYLWKRTKRNPMILPIIMEA